MLDNEGAHHTEFIEAATSLNITPRIQGNDIFLDVFITKDSLGDTTQRGLQAQPNIDTRQIKSSVKLKDGQTVVLGGIDDTEHSIILNKVPFLCDIPYLGEWLFTSRETKATNRQLTVFITPTILNTYNETDNIYTH